MGLIRLGGTVHSFGPKRRLSMQSDPRPEQKLIEEMTSVLKADEELRQDVSHELSTHFEDSKAAFLEEGKTENESDALALRAFGEPTQVAEQLADSNRGRMKTRAALRMFLGRILVPLSLLVALWMGVTYAERLDLVRMIDYLGAEEGGEDEDDGYFIKPVSSIPWEKQFLLYGDRTRPTPSSQERAIWEKYPDNKAYYANYLRLLLGDYQKKESEISFADLEKEIRRGEDLDPDNALYNYVLAAVLFKRGAEWKRDEADKNDKEGKWIIKDKALLAAAVTELNKAADKPHYRRYLDEILNQRLDLFPETRRLEDRVAKLAYLAGTVLPELGPIKGLFKAIPHYVESNDLTEAEARQLLDAWQGFVQKAVPDAWSLIDVLVLNAIISNAGEKTVEVYETKGLPDAATQTRLLAKKLGEPVERWKAAQKSQEAKDNLDRLLRQKGGILASMMLPSLGEPITEEMLRPGRQVERVTFEQFYLSHVLLILVGLMIGGWILCKICQKAGNGRSAPLLLLPPWRVALGILGLGILMPMFLYFAYTRWSGLSSYENSFRDFRVFLELALLTVTYLATSAELAAAYIRKRCQTLDLPTPKPANPSWRKLFWWGLGVAWLFCAGTRQLFGHQEAFETFLVFFGIGICLMFCGACVAIFIKGWKARRTHGLYYGTLARSLMPVYACAVIFLGSVCLPWLQKQESVLLRQDTLFASHPQGFTVIEGQLTQRLTTELADALKDAQGR